MSAYARLTAEEAVERARLKSPPGKLLTLAETTAVVRAETSARFVEAHKAETEETNIWRARLTGEAFWREHKEPTQYTKAQREKIQLWWMTQLWLAAHGHLRFESRRHLTALPIQPTKRNGYRIRATSAEFIQQLRAALAETHGSQVRAAKLLGASQRTVTYFVKRYGLRDEGDWTAFHARRNTYGAREVG